MTQKYGGSFAPPLSDETLATYVSVVEGMPESPACDACQKLCVCVKQWWELPESTSPGRPHQSGMGTIIDLDEQCKKALYDTIPWREELVMMQGLFDQLTGDARHVAHHLLWHVFELDNDREPITNDKL